MCISVVIPAYNVECYIARAIRSVFAQTYRPDEIIVVDDGSRDGTGKVIRSFGKAVRYVRQDHAGASAARNRGIELAQGKWIAFLDADDLWEPRRLAWQMALVARRPDLVWVSGEYLLAHGNIIMKRLGIPASFDWDGEVLKVLRFWAVGGDLGTSALLIRSQVIQEVGGFDPQFNIAEDTDLWFRIAGVYPEIGYVPRPLFRYQRENRNSLVWVSRRRKDGSANRFIAKHWPGRCDAHFLERDDLRAFFRRKIASYVVGSILSGNDVRARAVMDQARALKIDLPASGWRMKMRIFPPFVRRMLSWLWWHMRIVMAWFNCVMYRIFGCCNACKMGCSVAHEPNKTALR